MAWINMIDEDAADGALARMYDATRKRAGKVFNILKVQSSNAAVLKASLGLYREVMFGASPLTRAQREMLAVVVSATNACHY